MNRLADVLSFLRSKALTVWLLGALSLYYLTVAVWSKEAFASVVEGIARNNVPRSLYVLFLLNLTLRIVDRTKRLWQYKARLALQATLYAGLLLFLCVVFLSLNVRQTRWLLRGEGDPVELPWESAQYRVASVSPALREKALRTEGSAIFDYEPAVTLEDRSGRMHRIAAFPPVKVGSSYLHVLNFGIGPGVELRRGTKTLSEGNVALRLTPFGTVDKFTLEPYTIYLSILPDKVVTRGAEKAKEYDLKKPLYHVVITRGDREIARGETDSVLRFDDGMSLRFAAPYDWVLLEVAYDPFYPAYVASLLLLFIGSVLYPFSYLVDRPTPDADAA